MKKFATLLYIAFMLTAPVLHGVAPEQIRWHNEAADTTAITKFLIKATDFGASNPNELMEFIGRQFIDAPYKAGTLESQPEALTVNLEEFDCTTFIETVTALALTVEEHKNSWQDFIDNLETIRYRQGEVNGYSSRLHYFSDWIVSNTHRGIVREVTDRIPQSDSQIKTLDYMSRNRSSYPALADDAEYEAIKNMEVGFRSHRFPYIKSGRIAAKPILSSLRGGDIIAFTTKKDGLDISHVGIIVMENDGPRLLHASSREGKVTIDKLSLAEYLKKSPAITGIRVIRLQAQ